MEKYSQDQVVDSGTTSRQQNPKMKMIEQNQLLLHEREVEVLKRAAFNNYLSNEKYLSADPVTELEVRRKMSCQKLRVKNYLNVRLIKGWIKIKMMPKNINYVIVYGWKDLILLKKVVELLISQQIPEIFLKSNNYMGTNDKKLLTVLSRANSSDSPFN